MREIAIAIMVVGLCFYNGYLKVNNKDTELLPALFSAIGALYLLIN
jgi:fumarate reductase subunit D